MSSEDGALWSASREMNGLEALMWRAEADPRLRATMTVVDLLDRAPDWDRLVSAHDWATRMVPRLRQRVVEPAFGLGTPVWVTEAEIDLTYHLRRVRVPAPGTLQQLLEVAQTIAMTPFDRRRPPWEAVLVEGLEGGRAGYVLKSHHSVTDGMGGMQLVPLLHSRTREPMVDRPEPPAPAGESGDRIVETARQAAGRAVSLPVEVARGSVRLLGLAGRSARHPLRTTSDAVEFGRSLARVAAPPPTAPSPLLADRSRSWRFASLEVGLAELKAAAKAAGGSLNDAYLAAMLGGLRRYHEQLGSPVESLPVGIPISLRAGNDPGGGNRFAGARFAAPVGEKDPAERIRQVRAFVLGAKDEAAIEVTDMLGPLLGQLPGPVAAKLSGSMTSTNDVQMSNVPGVPYPVYIAGARIERMFPFGPLPGCAMMITLLSHDGTCCIGINADAAAVRDLDLMTRCLREGLDEVLALSMP